MTTTRIERSTPARIGPYEIVRKIGEGCLAEIFLASQKSLDRYVAIKVLHPRVSSNRELVERFEQESLTLAKLSHPNIVHIFDRGTDQGRLFFVMQYVEGIDFSQAIDSPEWSRQRRLRIIVQVLKGLDYAHKNGIIHRDIKPANILIDREENALITDFGISEFHVAEAGGCDDSGTVLGTYAYLSPEQRSNPAAVGETTDIFAVGLMLYEALTGKRPLGRYQAPSQLANGLSDVYDSIVARALQPKPAERYQKAVEMKDALLAAIHNEDAHAKGMIPGARKSKSFVGNCTFLDTLQENSVGSTYLVEERGNRKLYVIKKQNKPDIGAQESKLLSTMRHPNVLALQGAGSDGSKLVVIMDYAQGGSLADRMVKATAWRDALKIMKQIVAGMDFAHKHDVLHGNLKPANILFDRNDVVKIADFSLLSHVERKGITPYMAPEKRKSRASDIYAVGVIFYQLVTNRLPTAVSSGRFLWVDSHRAIPEPLRRLVERMLKNNPADRIQSFADIQEELSRLDTEVHVPVTRAMQASRSPNSKYLPIVVGAGLLLLTLFLLYLLGVLG